MKIEEDENNKRWLIKRYYNKLKWNKLIELIEMKNEYKRNKIK